MGNGRGGSSSHFPLLLPLPSPKLPACCFTPPSPKPLLCSALQRPAQGRTWPTWEIGSVTGSSSFVRTRSRMAQPAAPLALQVAWGTDSLSGLG